MLYLVGGLSYFVNFNPTWKYDPFGQAYFFHMGWFNHQLVHLSTYIYPQNYLKVGKYTIQVQLVSPQNKHELFWDFLRIIQVQVGRLAKFLCRDVPRNVDHTTLLKHFKTIRSLLNSNICVFCLMFFVHCLDGRICFLVGGKVASTLETDDVAR